MKTHKYFLLLLILSALAMFFVNGCDKRMVEVPEYFIQSMIATPNAIFPDNNTNTYSEIAVTVVDEDNSPVSGETVAFKVLADDQGVFLGNVTATATTSDNGIAIAQFNDQGQVGSVTIQASIGGKKRSVVVNVVSYNIQSVMASPTYLYPDNNETTYSEIRATVVDVNGQPATGETVSFKVLADSLGLFLGSVDATAVTGEDGIAISQFNDNGQLGTATIQASIGDASQTVIVNVIPVPDPEELAITTLTATPTVIYADGSEDTYSVIRAFVEDTNGYPAIGDTVNFRILSPGNLLGYVSAYAVTDNYGVAKTEFHDQGIVGVATIEASILNSSTTVVVSIEEVPSYHISNMTASPAYIYADNGITYSEIAVVVRDDDNFAVTGEYVQYRTSMGHILYNIMTDSTGVATSTFWDDGTIGTAVIDAFVGDVSSTIEVPIYETPQIDSLRMVCQAEAHVATVVEVKVTAFDSTGVVADGTIITFETTDGYFQNATGEEIGTLAQATTNNGIAKVNLYTDERAGEATISAYAQDEYVEKQITILPGVGRNISLVANPMVVHVNAGETSTTTAIVTDNYGNPVSTTVFFASSFGNITPSSTTNSAGIASATFSPGVEAGVVEITAEADSALATTQITVISDQVYSMEFAYSGKIDINILGTGGQESAEIVLNLYDSNGNLIDDNDSLWVNFGFVTAPMPTGSNPVGAN
ncbi:MAG TPA: hypothetical protein PLD62_05215, partial [Candidatus Cloacimonadota bacterium]|nr:hypothetical protein [Candidatus Cloacimonadota bacterium]